MYTPSLRDRVLQAMSVFGDLFDPEFSERGMTTCAFANEVHAVAFIGLCSREWPAISMIEFRTCFSKQDLLNALLPALQLQVTKHGSEQGFCESERGINLTGESHSTPSPARLN